MTKKSLVQINQWENTCSCFFVYSLLHHILEIIKIILTSTTPKQLMLHSVDTLLWRLLCETLRRLKSIPVANFTELSLINNWVPLITWFRVGMIYSQRLILSQLPEDFSTSNKMRGVLLKEKLKTPSGKAFPFE